MNIRLLNQDDVDIFRALRLKAVTEVPSAFTESIAEVTQKSFKDCADQLEGHGKGDFVLGAFDDNNHLVGTVGFYRSMHDKQFHKGTLWAVYVAPSGRQQGIGSALIIAAIDRAKNLSGISNITLCVTSSNESARRLYESKGFQVCGVEQRVLQIDGEYFDSVAMQLLL